MKYLEKNIAITKAIELANQGGLSQAKTELMSILEIDSTNNFLLINLASICFYLNEYDLAEKFLEKFLNSNEKKHSEFYFNAAHLFSQLAQFKNAVLCAEKLLSYFPNHPLAPSHLSNICYNSRDFKQAVEIAETINANEPSNIKIKIFLAKLYSGLGKFVLAEKLYKLALKLSPYDPYACSGLAKCRNFIGDNEQIRNIFKKALATKHDINSESAIRFSIAKLYNDVEIYDQAWEEAEKANNLQKKRIPFHQEKYIAYIDDLLEIYNNFSYGHKKPLEKKSHILIVGMPRSGTTLTEQILSSDENIYPGGERQGIDYAILRALGDGEFLNKLKNSNNSDFIKMSHHYFNYFNQFSNFKGSRILDKVPSNYLFIGIFKLMFYDIKIINIHRNPLDVASSIFFENFSKKLNYTNDVGDILCVYKQYKRIMSFWNKLIPENILNLEYEELISNHQTTKEKIINFCNLELDPNKEYLSSDNIVETPSSWQVRQGIYKTSVERWKRYEKYLLKYQFDLEKSNV